MAKVEKCKCCHSRPAQKKGKCLPCYRVGAKVAAFEGRRCRCGRDTLNLDHKYCPSCRGQFTEAANEAEPLNRLMHALGDLGSPELAQATFSLLIATDKF